MSIGHDRDDSFDLDQALGLLDDVSGLDAEMAPGRVSLAQSRAGGRARVPGKRAPSYDVYGTILQSAVDVPPPRWPEPRREPRLADSVGAEDTGDAGRFAQAVQRREAAAAVPASEREAGSDVALATAATGVAGAGQQLPHADRIQASFGRHDVSGIRAHVGGAAADAAGALGAEAYATGSDVAFRGEPDLHTAAHEAAHVVQQRAGAVQFKGVNASGDSHEKHADAVADAVVAGRSAEPLLDALPKGGGTPSAAIQRREGREPIEWATTPAPQSNQTPRPVGSASSDATNCSPAESGSRNFRNLFLLNEIHDNSLLLFEGMNTALDSTVTTLQEPSGSAPSLFSKLIGIAAKGALSSSKAALGGSLSFAAAPLGTAVTRAVDSTLGKAVEAPAAAPLACFQETVQKQIMMLRGAFTSAFWGNAAELIDSWDLTVLRQVSMRLWQADFVHAAVAYWKREMVVAWANYLAQHHHGSANGAVDYRTVDDQNIAERSHYWNLGDPRSRGVLNVDIHYSHGRTDGANTTETTLHRLYVNGLPDELKTQLRTFRTVRDARMNTIIRVLSEYADTTHSRPYAVLVVGPHGQLIRRDTAIEAAGMNVQEVIDAAMDMLMKELR